MTESDERSWRDDADDPGSERTGDQRDVTDDQRSDGDGGTRELRTGDDATAARTPFTQQVGRVIIFVAAVLFGVFAVANVDSVPFNWIFGESDVPLIVLLIVAFGFGALIAWLATIRTRRG